MKLRDLKPDKRNANRGTARGNAVISDSLRKYGAGRSILLDKHGTIIAGNKTAENAEAAGLEDVLVVQTTGDQLVAVQRMDLDLELDPRARELAIADNRASEVSLDWDVEALKGLALDGVDLAPFFTADELESFWPQNPLQGDEDEVPPVPVEPKSKLGDLYILGNHRLLCGDSTKREDVERLMGGQKAALIVTDPPWNVAYGTNLANNAMNYKPRLIANDDLGTADWLKFLGEFVARAKAAAVPGCPLYLVMGPSEWPAIDDSLRRGGFHWSSTIIWAKDQLVMSRKDYHTQYEPIWYGWKDGAARIRTVQDRKQSDLWQCNRPHDSPLHPTTKPVELIERAVLNSSDGGAAVLDLFGGSGSTLIACEKTGRKCFMMELSPAYCDVIVTRWENATGKKAVLEGA